MQPFAVLTLLSNNLFWNICTYNGNHTVWWEVDWKKILLLRMASEEQCWGRVRDKKNRWQKGIDCRSLYKENPKAMKEERKKRGKRRKVRKKEMRKGMREAGSLGNKFHAEHCGLLTAKWPTQFVSEPEIFLTGFGVAILEAHKSPVFYFKSL